MRSDKRTTGVLAAALAVAAALLLGACGAGDGDARAERKAPKLASAQALEKDPYAIACGHVRDQQRWASETRRATVAIGDHERIPGLNRLQATQSVFFAMTEVCKGRAASYEPAELALQGVRQGKYRADLGRP
jgi:uncharacterized protein HemX